jgi:hypothetical protein
VALLSSQSPLGPANDFGYLSDQARHHSQGNRFPSNLFSAFLAVYLCVFAGNLTPPRRQDPPPGFQT